MQSKSTQDLSQLSIYKKAIEVFTLSRRIVAYITDDKDVLSLRRSNEKIDILANNIIINSLGLIPKIVETENEKDTYSKFRLAQSLTLFINELNKSCIFLECTKVPGKDFLNMLRIELKKLQLLHKNYVNSIIEA